MRRANLLRTEEECVFYLLHNALNDQRILQNMLSYSCILKFVKVISKYANQDIKDTKFERVEPLFLIFLLSSHSHGFKRLNNTLPPSFLPLFDNLSTNHLLNFIIFIDYASS
jgi:hypothetical protein